MGSMFQAVGQIADAVADIFQPGQSKSNAPIDLKQAALELVMPKLDAQTLAKYIDKWSENVQKDLEQKEEQERLAKAEQQRKQNLGLEKPEEKLVLADKGQQKKRDGYSVTDYMEAADAASKVAKFENPERSNEDLLRKKVLEDKERIS